MKAVAGSFLCFVCVCLFGGGGGGGGTPVPLYGPPQKDPKRINKNQV